LNLTLYLSVAAKKPFNDVQRTDPRIILFAPPNQPTIHRETKTLGRVEKTSAFMALHPD
jgi:hypothetical protein